MFDAFCLGLALTVGQGGPAVPAPLPPSGQSSFASERPPATPAATRPPAKMPPSLLPPAVVPAAGQVAPPARLGLFPVGQAAPLPAPGTPAPPLLPVTPMAPAAPAAPAAPMVTAPAAPALPAPEMPGPVLITKPGCCIGGTKVLTEDKKNGNGNGDKKEGNGDKKDGNGDKKDGDKKDGNGDKKDGNGNGDKKDENGDKKDDEKKDEEKKDDRGYFMKSLDKTWLGACMEAEGIKVDGWMAFSYNASTRNVTNLPVTWNDRADVALLQQFWVNIGKDIDWEKKEFQTGWKVALMYGSDYRFTLTRGFLNNQLKNWKADPNELNGFEQNIYGGDIPNFYYSVFVPGLCGEGTQVDVGRIFTPWGYESVMATATPFMSRSYAFNWAPPFFHYGAMATTKVDKNLTVKNAIVNGNDVFFDGSQEWRYVGVATLTSDDEKTTLSLGTSLGRGRFNPDRPNGPAQGITTLGLAYEPFGRNNFNAFDLVLTHKLDDKCSVAFEGIYAYQTNVPAAATGSVDNFNGGSGTASWLSGVGYFMYNINDKCTFQTRFEAFYDAEGQRTGFEGLYYSTTVGFVCKPCDSVIIRPEVRYDCNNYSRPFTGRHDILVAGGDVIIKF